MSNNGDFSVVDQVKGMIAVLKTVIGFKIGKDSPIASGAENLAKAIEAGKQEEILTAGKSVLVASRNILGAFLRNSVVDRVVDGETIPAMFTKELVRRDEEAYDEDIIARLEKLRSVLLDAVRVETNGTFNVRIEAYNALKRAVDEADAEQRRRDNVRKVKDEATKKAAAQAARNGVTIVVVRDDAAKSRREKLVAAKKAAADEVRSLIKF